MLKITNEKHIELIRENEVIECKLARGRDGHGALPEDIWETVSAFSNSQGGYILLGLEEQIDETYVLEGINNLPRVLKQFWEGLRDEHIISPTAITPSCINIHQIKHKALIQIHVPRAHKKIRPVHLKRSPIGGSYKRIGSSDIRIKEIIIRKMLAENLALKRKSRR